MKTLEHLASIDEWFAWNDANLPLFFMDPGG